MSIQPNEFPGRSDRTIPVISPVRPLAALPSAEETWAAVKRLGDNRIEAELLFNYTALPHPVVVPTPERVYVTVADVDDLAVWLYERGGDVHVSAEFEGVKTYVLHTHTDARRDGARTEIWVSCAVPSYADVLHEVRAAVTR